MPDKIDEIATIFSEIHRGDRIGKIKFIIGDGFYSQQGIKSRAIILATETSQGRPINDVRDQDRACWRAYEAYRYYTWNKLPPRRYCYMRHFCETGYVDAILTTNYDLYFDSIFDKDPIRQGFILNPVIHDADYTGEGFLGRSSQSSNKLRLWKIHGSFSHASYITTASTCRGHIYKLPAFYMAQPENLIEAGLQPHEYHGNMASPLCDCDRLAHFIDMNFHRDAFAQIIESSVNDLCSTDTALVIALGFTGRYDPNNSSDIRNEEIVPHIIANSNSKPTYTILAPFQNPEDSYLYKQMAMQGKAIQGDIEFILRQLIITYNNQIGNNGSDTLRQIDQYHLSKWASGLFDHTPY